MEANKTELTWEEMAHVAAGATAGDFSSPYHKGKQFADAFTDWASKIFKKWFVQESVLL